MTTKKMSDALVMQAASRIMHQNTLNRLKQIANGEIKESDENNTPENKETSEKKQSNKSENE